MLKATDLEVYGKKMCRLTRQLVVLDQFVAGVILVNISVLVTRLLRRKIYLNAQPVCCSNDGLTRR